MKDVLQTKIEELAKLPGLAPETVTLIEMAQEAQRTGKIPELPASPEIATEGGAA